jgi:hypothetical protein
MDYEMNFDYSDIEEDENDVPLNVLPLLEEENLREWVPVTISQGDCDFFLLSLGSIFEIMNNKNCQKCHMLYKNYYVPKI